MPVIHITDANFNSEVIESQVPVLVDFWAEWCGPCRMIGPVLEELAGEFKGRVKIGKVNVDNNSEIPSRYGIMSIPTLIFFKNGEVLDQIVGALSKGDLKSKIEDNI